MEKPAAQAQPGNGIAVWPERLRIAADQDWIDLPCGCCLVDGLDTSRTEHGGPVLSQDEIVCSIKDWYCAHTA